KNLSQRFDLLAGNIHHEEKNRVDIFSQMALRIQQSQEQTRQLLGETQKISTILDHSNVRGAFGEMLFEDLLKSCGFVENIHYEKQMVMEVSSLRPDFVFKLSGEVVLAADVKFPLKHFSNEISEKEFLADI